MLAGLTEPRIAARVAVERDYALLEIALPNVPWEHLVCLHRIRGTSAGSTTKTNSDRVCPSPWPVNLGLSSPDMHGN